MTKLHQVSDSWYLSARATEYYKRLTKYIRQTECDRAGRRRATILGITAYFTLVVVFLVMAVMGWNPVAFDDRVRIVCAAAVIMGVVTGYMFLADAGASDPDLVRPLSPCEEVTLPAEILADDLGHVHFPDLPVRFGGYRLVLAEHHAVLDDVGRGVAVQAAPAPVQFGRGDRLRITRKGDELFVERKTSAQAAWWEAGGG
ncbi:MAG TPA: hypothetical protein VKD22_08430 [Ramlibacter sp.]|nr:hypothetical protein [Ramlibacter sp.]